MSTHHGETDKRSGDVNVAVGEAIGLVDLALKATAAYGRPDLGERLRQTRERLAEPDVRVLVVGEFKQGKSQLVNAIIGADVCPVDDDIATSVPTMVRHAGEFGATLVHESGDRQDVPVNKLAQHVSEQGNASNADRLRYVEVGAPRQLLSGGLVLVDTPGVGGLGSAHAAATMGALAGADAVLLISDAAQEYTRPEMDFLADAIRLCPNVACVLTKTDLYRSWRRIAEIDRGHLKTAGVDAEMFPVASTLRLQALTAKDKELNNESGFPKLIAYLRDRIVGQVDTLDRRSAGQDVLEVAEQLAITMRTELTALREPEDAERLVAELTRAKTQASELKQRSARWQTTLNDGVADLNADIDHDLRDRLRKIMRLAEEAIDDGDPEKIWDQFSAWVSKEVSRGATSSFVSATERARMLAIKVADHFASGGTAVMPKLRMGDAEGAQGRAAELVTPDLKKFGKGEAAFAMLRGGYMGAMMFGMLTSLAGLAALVTPVGVGAGVLLGGKAIRDERKKRLEKRRSEAKAAVRKHIDDVTFQVAKDCRDMLREMQRTLRDHFIAHAEQLSNSINESVQASQQALKSSETERASRIRDLEAELKRVDGLAASARALTTGAAAGKAT